MVAQHEKYEEKLKQSAEKAFDELPVENNEEAQAAHAQLLNWLVGMDRITKNPQEMVTDDMANVGCNVMDAILAQQAKKGGKGKAKWAAMIKAFGALSDDDQLNLVRALLGETLKTQVRNCALVTRANDMFLWENVGFHIDGDIKCAFAKVGRNAYQAIGFDDGERYIGTEGSKTLWSREFGMALILPYAPPFHVERVELEEDTLSSPVALSDKEREKIEEALTWFEEDLANHAKLETDDKDGRAELEDKMRETIKLARIRLPRLDEKLDAFSDDNPEVGESFENIEITQMVVSCAEFLRMKLDDDTVRRDVEATVVATGPLDAQQHSLLDTLIEGIAKHIPKEGDEPDSEGLMLGINQAAISLPAVRELLQEFDPASNVMQAAEAVLIWLQKEKDRLPQVAASE